MKYLAILVGTIILTGCSSASKELVVNEVPYCHTSSTTVLKDSTTSSSETVVECTDKPNPVAQWQANTMDGKRCGWAPQEFTLRGRTVISYTMACQLQDGSWMYVPNAMAN